MSQETSCACGAWQERDKQICADDDARQVLKCKRREVGLRPEGRSVQHGKQRPIIKTIQRNRSLVGLEPDRHQFTPAAVSFRCCHDEIRGQLAIDQSLSLRMNAERFHRQGLRPGKRPLSDVACHCTGRT